MTRLRPPRLRIEKPTPTKTPDVRNIGCAGPGHHADEPQRFDRLAAAGVRSWAILELTAVLGADQAALSNNFTAVIGIDPDNWGALFGRGYARMLLGAYEGAIEDYDQVIRLRPDDPLVRHDRQMAIERAEAAGR